MLTRDVVNMTAGRSRAEEDFRVRSVRNALGPILDHSINVDEIPEPHRLAERGW
jgi:hypothetical protein